MARNKSNNRLLKRAAEQYLQQEQQEKQARSRIATAMIVAAPVAGLAAGARYFMSLRNNPQLFFQRSIDGLQKLETQLYRIKSDSPLGMAIQPIKAEVADGLQTCMTALKRGIDRLPYELQTPGAQRGRQTEPATFATPTA